MPNSGRPVADAAQDSREAARLHGKAVRRTRSSALETSTVDPQAPAVSTPVASATTTSRVNFADSGYSETHYRTLLDLSPQVVWASDNQGNNTYCNQHWYELTGLTQEQSSGRGWVAALHPDDLSRMRDTGRRALATSTPYDEEIRLRRASDGQYRWHLMRGVPLRDADGVVSHWMGIGVDIHDRKIARSAIELADQRTSLAIEAANIGTWDVYPETGDVECSLRCLEIFQTTNTQPKLEDFFAAVHDEDRPRVSEMLKRALDPNGDGEYDIEYRIVRADGSVRWLYAKGKSFFTGEGVARVASRFSGMVIDISDRRTTERDRASLAAALWDSPDFIGITDVKGRCLFLNRAGQEMVGLRSDEEARTKFAFDFLAPAERAIVQHEMLPMVKAGKVWERDFMMRHMITGEPILVETRVFGIFDEHGRLTRMVNLSRDISEKRKLEEQLGVAQKMEAVGRLAGGVAHDFNNLLTIIRGATEMLQQRGVNGDGQAIIKEIRDAAERASALTDQLLSFGKQKVVRPQPMNLNRAIGAIQHMLQRLAGEDITLHVELDKELHNIKMDPVHIDQILINLVANARDAMPHGGQIRIRTFNQQGPCKPPEAGCAECVCLSFSDNGRGMSPGELTHIFEPFFTTKRDGRNSGLGLATLYGIVQEAHGHIEVTSARGQGTAFTIHLPRTDEKVVEEVPAQQHLDLPHSGTILLVEDESSLRGILATFLREHGYHVLEASDAHEAAVIAANVKIELLVSDIVMPGISGAGLASELSSTHPHMKVIFMSGYADHAELQPALQHENAVFLHKPFRFSDLMAKIRHALNTQAASNGHKK